MSNCGWCGNQTRENTELRIEQFSMVWGREEEKSEGYPVSFCCTGCYWAFEVESHRIYGITGKEIREHLVEEHGMLYPPGPAAGKMSVDCRTRFEEMAEKIAKFFGLK